MARSPALVADARSLYVVGNNLPFNDQPVRVGETLTAWRVGYGSIGAPAPDLAFVSPKATLDSAERLQLLWAEPDAPAQIIPPFQWMLLRTSSIWTAAYEPGRGWSSPARVYAGPIDWVWRVTSGAIAEGVDGERLIAVPQEQRGVLVLSLRHGQWTVTTVPVPGMAAYVSVLGVGRRRLLAVVTADMTQAQDRNSVFVYAQDDDGPWRLLKQVQRSGGWAAMESRLLKGAGGRIHLVWRQMLAEDAFVIRHVQSDDEGASFSEASDLLPGGILQNVEAVVDACGRVHVVYEDWSERTIDAVHIGYAVWDGRWSRPQRLHPAFTAGDLTLLRRVDGSLMVAFLGSTTPADRSTWTMMQSELR